MALTRNHKGLKRVTLICLPCPMLVNIHFRKYHIWNEKKSTGSFLLGMVAVLGKTGLRPGPKLNLHNLRAMLPHLGNF